MLAIAGCGGHARSVFSAIKHKNEVSCFVDLAARPNEFIMGIPVLKIIPNGIESLFIAIGDNKKREGFYKNHLDYFYTKVISESAVLGDGIEIKFGTFIGQLAYLGPQSMVGHHSIVNTGAVLEHESSIGNFSHVAPHATICGRSHVGNNVFIGAGATVIDGVNICDNVIVGAGATVVRDINKPGIYCGTPAVADKTL